MGERGATLIEVDQEVNSYLELRLGCKDIKRVSSVKRYYPMDCNTIRTAQGANFLTF